MRCAIGRMLLLTAVVFLGTVSRETRAEETVTKTSFAPGNHFGFTVRTTTGGDWTLHSEETETDYPENNEHEVTYQNYESGSFGASPGFGIHWEYLTAGRVVALGVWVGAQFYSFEEFDYRMDLGAELQIDPRLRIFFSRTGWWRPYTQLAVGFSLGIPSKSVSNEDGNNSDYVKRAFALNASGWLGSLFAPASSPVAFFLEVGIEGAFFWFKEIDGYDESEKEFDGRTRQFVIALGLEI